VKSKSRLPYIGKADDIGGVLKGVQNRRPTFQKWPWHLAKDMNIEKKITTRRTMRTSLEVNWNASCCGPFTRGVVGGGGAI
jgi:hypothetical protein